MDHLVDVPTFLKVVVSISRIFGSSPLTFIPAATLLFLINVNGVPRCFWTNCNKPSLNRCNKIRMNKAQEFY